MYEFLAIFIVLFLVALYLYNVYRRENRRDRELLDKIKSELIPTLILNLENLSIKLSNPKSFIEDKVSLSDIYYKDISRALYFDFKERFPKLLTELGRYQTLLKSIDDAVISGELDKVENFAREAKELNDKLIEKLNSLLKLEKLPPKQGAFRSFR